MQLRPDRRALAIGLLLLLAGCARHRRVAPVPEAVAGRELVRVAISIGAATATVSTSSLLSIVHGRSGAVLATSRRGFPWDVRAVGADGIELSRDGERPVLVSGAPVHLTADQRTGYVVLGTTRFRGSLSIFRDGSNLLVVNTVAIEDYLRSVVSLEIGTRTENEQSAVAAQSVAARSYTHARIAARRRDASRRYDLLADVSDQVYGGVDAEIASVVEQVQATRGLVLTYGGRVVEALYSAACGGFTAQASEIWRGNGQPYYSSVSDRRPDRDGYYCDIAPRFTWSTEFDRTSLLASLNSYLRNYSAVAGTISRVDSFRPGERTASGRVSTLAIFTDAGRHELFGDHVRFVLRTPGGAILRSTRYEIESETDSVSGVVRVALTGSGYGHGVGMCQWGAIGRARDGQDFRAILTTYYPGTRVERVAQSGE